MLDTVGITGKNNCHHTDFYPKYPIRQSRLTGVASENFRGTKVTIQLYSIAATLGKQGLSTASNYFLFCCRLPSSRSHVLAFLAVFEVLAVLAMLAVLENRRKKKLETKQDVPECKF